MVQEMVRSVEGQKTSTLVDNVKLAALTGQSGKFSNPASTNSLASVDSNVSCWTDSTLTVPSICRASELQDISTAKFPIESKINETEVLKTLCKSLMILASKANVEMENVTTLPFSMGTVPKIDLGVYLQRCIAYLNEVFSMDEKTEEVSSSSVSPGFAMLVMACVYVDRLMERHVQFRLHRMNVHRLFLTGIVIATKQSRDKTIPNKFMARVGGIHATSLNHFEIDLCTMLEFNLHVSREEFDRTLKSLLPTQ